MYIYIYIYIYIFPDGMAEIMSNLVFEGWDHSKRIFSEVAT